MSFGSFSTSAASSGESASAIFVNPYATVNVKTHIPITLEFKHPNFNKWKAFFTAMCGKFGLLPHIDGTAPPRPDESAWAQADCCVRGWLFGSVSDAILDVAMEPDQTARDLCVAIDELFQANKEPRAIYLSHEFHSLTQGNLSIADYCQKVKTAADALRDVGHPVTESQLVLNLLSGLNPRFSCTADNIAGAPVLPSFASARNTLLLKELRIANDTKVQNETAMVAAASPANNSTSGTCAASSSQPRGGGGGGGGGGGSNNGGWRNQRRNGGWNNGGGGNGGHRTTVVVAMGTLEAVVAMEILEVAILRTKLGLGLPARGSASIHGPCSNRLHGSLLEPALACLGPTLRLTLLSPAHMFLHQLQAGLLCSQCSPLGINKVWLLPLISCL